MSTTSNPTNKSSQFADKLLTSQFSLQTTSDKSVQFANNFGQVSSVCKQLWTSQFANNFGQVNCKQLRTSQFTDKLHIRSDHVEMHWKQLEINQCYKPKTNKQSSHVTKEGRQTIQISIFVLGYHDCNRVKRFLAKPLKSDTQVQHISFIIS